MSSLNKTLNNDSQWQAFVGTNAILEPVTMGVASAGGDAILVEIEAGAKTTVMTVPAEKADFTLSTKPDQWEKFFDADPKSPFTSFVARKA